MVALTTELESLWQSAESKMHEFQKGTTGQGFHHCTRVEGHIWSLIHENIHKFRPMDLFILSASAALHDIGRIEGGDALEKEDHGELAKKRLLREGNWREFFQDKTKAQAVAFVISVHSSGKIDDIPEEFVMGNPPGILLRSLAAIFRLADMLDSDYRRCPYVVKSFKDLRFSDSIKWIARSSISGWEKSRDNKTILLMTSLEKEGDKIKILAYVDSLNESLTESQKKHLENCTVQYLNDDDQWKKETLHFPIHFSLAEYEKGVRRELGGLTSLYVATAERYISQITTILSDVDLRGIGDFQAKKSTNLSNVFIDINVTLDSGRVPENYEDFNGKAVARINRDLRKGSLSVTEAVNIEKLKKIVLLGDPGSGKTTISRYLCLKHPRSDSNNSDEKARQEKAGLPFLVTVREFVSERRAKPKMTLTKYLANWVNSFIRPSMHLPSGFVEFWLRKENSITIFDGLDEVMEFEDKISIRNLITDFVNTFPEGKFLVTSRIVGYDEAPLDRNSFLHLHLLALGKPQMEMFVRNWYKEREANPRDREAAIRGLLEALKEKNVGDLAENPLLLTIMALVHYAEADLPKQRAKLYEKCVEAFLVNRDRARDLVSYNEDEIRTYHEFLGYWMHSRADTTKEGTSEVPLEELKKILLGKIAERYPHSEQPPEKKVKEFIEAARRRVGLIVEKGQGIFAFGHRSFQEYFAARYISQTAFGIDKLWPYIQDKIEKSYWIEVLKLLAGIYGQNNKSALDLYVSKLLNEDSKIRDPLHRRLILAGEITGDKVPLKDDVQREITDRIIKLFPETQNSRLMNNCKMVLEHLLNTSMEKYMIEELRKIQLRNYVGSALYMVYISKQFGNTRIDRIIATL